MKLINFGQITLKLQSDLGIKLDHERCSHED